MEGIVTQIIVPGLGGAIGTAIIIGLIIFLGRIYLRWELREKPGEALEKATAGLDPGLKGTQGNVNETRLGLQSGIYETRQGFQGQINGLRREFWADLQRTEDRLRQEFRADLQRTEKRLRDQIRAESEATREATRNEIRRLTDAFAVHSHEANGTITYRIPPHYSEPRPEGAGE